MKTDTLINLLASHAGPAPRFLAMRRLSVAALLGLPVSVVTAITLFGMLPSSMFVTAVPWMKIAYAASVALSAAWLTARLSRPAAPFLWPQRLTVLVMLAMLVLGMWSLMSTPAGERVDALLGPSWWACPVLCRRGCSPTIPPTTSAASRCWSTPA